MHRMQASQQARRRQLALRTYSVVPFTEDAGMLQVNRGSSCDSKEYSCDSRVLSF